MVHRSEHHKETWFAKTMCSYIAHGELKKLLYRLFHPTLKHFQRRSRFWRFSILSISTPFHSSSIC